MTRRGRENIKFCSFLRAIRESPLRLMGLVRILVERTYFVGVGALDDPKKQSIIAAQTPSAQCALKPFSMKVFGATFFQKGSK